MPLRMPAGRMTSVWIATPPRSGSTWAFNVARRVLEAGGWTVDIGPPSLVEKARLGYVRAAAEARRHEADAHAEQAIELLRRGAPDQALREARRALEIAPDHSRATAAVAEVQRREAESRQAREHARARRERFKAAAPHVETARRALDAGDFTRGAWACEQALALAGLCMDLTGDTGPQDLVLFLQELDIPGELAIGGGRDQGQERMEDLDRGGMVVIR